MAGSVDEDFLDALRGGHGALALGDELARHAQREDQHVHVEQEADESADR